MLKVKIIKEVHSDKQRKFFCASDDPELNAMCDDPMKEEQLDEISAMAGGGVEGGVFGDEEKVKKFNEEEKKKSQLKGAPLEEEYSTAGLTPGDAQIYMDDETNDGRIERMKHQGLKNECITGFHQSWKKFLKS